MKTAYDRLNFRVKSEILPELDKTISPDFSADTFWNLKKISLGKIVVFWVKNFHYEF